METIFFDRLHRTTYASNARRKKGVDKRKSRKYGEVNVYFAQRTLWAFIIG